MKKLVNEGYFKGEVLKRARDDAYQAMQLLDGAASTVREVLGEDDWLFQRLDSHANEVDDTLDDFTAMVEGMSEEDYATPVNESGSFGWFDNNGWLLKSIPSDCILDCSGSGNKDDQVAYWVEELGFDRDFPRENAIRYLKEFGAWEVEELESMPDSELAGIVLWEFCNDLVEQANDKTEEELEEVGLPSDVSEWSSEDWTLFQTELGLVSLNH